MNILVVDDEDFLRDELIFSLEKLIPDAEYSEAADYSSAVKLINENHFDIAFLDINIPGKNGLSVAEIIKKKSYDTDIVFVTAYGEYAVDAFKLFASGYILKPVNDAELKSVLDHILSSPEAAGEKKLEVRCFGNFELLSKGKPIKFKRSLSKEIMAYLICQRGTSVNRNEICAMIFPDEVSTEQAIPRFKIAFHDLEKDMSEAGINDVIIHNKNAYSVDTKLISCDYYDYLTGKPGSENSYHGEFLNQYSWGEEYIYELEEY